MTKTEFESFFKQQYKPACLYAYRWMGNNNDVEERVQQCFVRFWEKQIHLPKEQAIAYLMTMVKNECLSFLRSEKQKQSHLNQYKITQLNLQESPSVDVEEIKKQLSIAITSLPPKCRTIFEMNKKRGLTYQEIAIELSIAEKTVENQMGRAYQLLRAYFNGHQWPFVLLLCSQQI